MRQFHLRVGLAVVLAVLAAACDGGDGGVPDGSEAGRPTASPPPSPVDPREERVVEEGESIASGKHVVGTFRPRFSFTYEGERPLRVSRQTDRLLILDLEVPRQLVFARPERVYAHVGGSPALRPAPADLADWVEMNPHLKVEDRFRTSVGGERGQVVDVLVTSIPKTQVGECPIPCVPLVPLDIDDRSVFLVDGQQARFVFLDAGNEQMFVMVPSAPRDFKRALRAAEEFLQTVRF